MGSDKEVVRPAETSPAPSLPMPPTTSSPTKQRTVNFATNLLFGGFRSPLQSPVGSEGGVASNPVTIRGAFKQSVNHRENKDSEHNKPTTVRLDDPICLGYLLKYAESEMEYNSESIHFLVDVDRLRDMMMQEMEPVWNQKHWMDIDTDIMILEKGKGKYDDEQYIETLEKVQKYFVKQKATNEIPKTVVVTTTTGNEQIPLVFEGKTAGLNDDQLGVPLKDQSQSLGQEVVQISNVRIVRRTNNNHNNNQQPTNIAVVELGQAIQDIGLPLPRISGHDGIRTPDISISDGDFIDELPDDPTSHPSTEGGGNIVQDKLTSGGDKLGTKAIKPKPIPIYWPKRQIGKEMIDKEIVRIWKTYLDIDAVRLITVAPTVLKRTRMRAKYSALYGPDIFAEALIDAVKNIKSGILPRFIQSPEHAKMLEFSDGSKPLPSGSSLDVPPPYRSIYTVMDLDILPTKKFSCRELVSDRLLFHQFYTYLRQRDSHDSLLGVRMLTIFEERVTVKDWEHAEQVAWEIYRYFVARESSFAVEIDDIELKEILRSLAKPRMDMFDPIKRTVTTSLKMEFERFKSTDIYEGLNTIVMESLKRQKQSDLVMVKGGCSCSRF